jgi:hypothetical protein
MRFACDHATAPQVVALMQSGRSQTAHLQDHSNDLLRSTMWLRECQLCKRVLRGGLRLTSTEGTPAHN